MARNVQNVESAPVKKTARTKVAPVARKDENVAIARSKPRSNSGRKAEAIKDLIPPVKRYRTRKDYVGSGWQNDLLKVTKDSPLMNFAPTKTAQKAAKKIVKKPVATNTQNNPIVMQMVTTDASGNSTKPLPAEFAYNLMQLCSKYIFVMKDAFNGVDGISEIDIHIKVRPDNHQGAVTC